IPHTTILTRKDISDSQAVDLPSLLQREAGFEYTQNGGVGGVTGLFMRGGRSAPTSVLVDRMRVEDASSGSARIQRIMLDDGYRNESVSGNLIQRISAQHEVGVLLYHSRGRLDYDNAFGAPTDTHQSAQDLRMSQAYWEAHPVEPWTSRLTLGEGTDYRTDLLNGAFDSSSNTRSRQLIWDNRLQAAPAHEFAVGLEALRQELQNSDLLPQRRDRNADVARLGYLGRLGAHSLQVNLRTEDYSDFGRANTHFLGYGYDVTQAWRLTASTSTAFRAPTFIDLFGFGGFGGNAALRPERARTREL